jgi:hypothetical protein
MQVGCCERHPVLEVATQIDFISSKFRRVDNNPYSLIISSNYAQAMPEAIQQKN